jgi:hypothetical protein
MPLDSPPPAPEPPPAPAAAVGPPTTLDGILATFGAKKAIVDAFAELRKAWLHYESAEAWEQALKEHGIEGDNFGTVGRARKCFTALWRACERFMAEHTQEVTQ